MSSNVTVMFGRKLATFGLGSYFEENKMEEGPSPLPTGVNWFTTKKATTKITGANKNFSFW